jgi:hypothetical protein
MLISFYKFLLTFVAERLVYMLFHFAKFSGSMAIWFDIFSFVSATEYVASWDVWNEMFFLVIRAICTGDSFCGPDESVVRRLRCAELWKISFDYTFDIEVSML